MNTDGTNEKINSADSTDRLQCIMEVLKHYQGSMEIMAFTIFGQPINKATLAFLQLLLAAQVATLFNDLATYGLDKVLVCVNVFVRECVWVYEGVYVYAWGGTCTELQLTQHKSLVCFSC